jgi:hypothetical protein
MTGQTYADSLLTYPGVKEIIAEAPENASYITLLLLAKRRFNDQSEGGYATCVADRAFEWLRQQWRAQHRAGTVA